MEMASYIEGRGLIGETEPVGLITEGAAGIAAIVLTILSLAGISTALLTAIAVIVIGVGLMVQGFNTAAEHSRVVVNGASTSAHAAELGGAVMIDFLAGGAGVVLGILGLIGINASYLLPAALIVFGGALLLAGASTGMIRSSPVGGPATQPTAEVSYRGSVASSGLQVLIGVAAIVLGTLALILVQSWVLVLVGLLAVGAALLMISATFSGAVLRMFAA
jgi:hypothetical protein